MFNTNPQIGKDVIESLTLGMYDDCRFIYREYVQNAADAIDKAILSSILEKGSDQINIIIDADRRYIEISDNGTGITRDSVVPLLQNIAHSTKKRGEDKGFRGIGRLGGLGYCSKLRFETSHFGENVKSIMIWDADLLKCIINDRSTNEDAVDVLKRITNTNFEEEDPEAHYFRVIMEDVSSDDLLDEKGVTEYLSMVAPVEISSDFIYSRKINEFIKKNNLIVDSYNIFVNSEQIFKPYTTGIYEDNNGGKKCVDRISDVEFLLQKDDDDNIIYWGWYTISELKGQMKPKNVARGIRLRKENIQIGDEEICKKFFSKTEDQRFSFYYFGEIHALSKGLIPNSRRDYFSESKECVEFENRIKSDFLKLKELCYDAQKIRSSVAVFNKTEELRQIIEEKEQNGYTSQKERDDLHRKLEDSQKKTEVAKKQYLNVRNKIEENGSPLKSFIVKIESKTAEKNELNEVQNDYEVKKKPKFRTDRPIYSKFDKREKKLIGKVYFAIENVVADERMRESLIAKIEEVLTK